MEQVMWLIAVLLIGVVYFIAKVYDEVRDLRMEAKLHRREDANRATIADFEATYGSATPQHPR